MTQEVPPKPDILKIARSRRHLKMMESLQQGKTLSIAEIRELAQYEGGESNPLVLETQEYVAKVFKVTVRTVRNWIESGMPVAKDGRYDLSEIVAWKFMRDIKQFSDEKKEGIDWLTEYRKYKAKNEESKHKLTKRDLISKHEVEEGLVQVSIAIKRALLSLPRSIAPRLIGLEAREIEAVLRERVEEIINLFAKDLIFGKSRRRVKKGDQKTEDMDG